ncbi:hypothetical protein ACFQ1L_13490 [Phytohabitans flavus]|uniref:hypothetical protein n=1 Tax=Phytohabitans flavus TaxID=1076124 RepID=UPI001565FFD2|nr:hypothetical protein [Phytohabitans flavus]
MRIGVLISVAITALMLRWSVEAPWWSERTDVGGFHASAVDLAGFGGSPFAWCAAVACLAFAVAALPVPRRVRRTACAAGLAASVGAASVWAVLLGQVLRRDADTRRGWAAEIWARHIASGGADVSPPLAETNADGLNLALIVVFLLLVVGGVLAFPRRHERTVLLIATMVNIAAALTTPLAAVWVTTGPGTAKRDWFWTSELLAAAGPTVVALVVMVPILGAGLFLRPGGAAQGWRVVWAITASIYCYVAYFVVMIDTSSGPPLHDEDVPDSAAFPTDWGVGVIGPFSLVVFLPLIVVIRVVCADSAAVKRAAIKALRVGPLTDHSGPALPAVADPGPIGKDEVLSDRVQADPPLGAL